MTANLRESAARGNSTPALTHAAAQRAKTKVTMRLLMASIPLVRRPLRQAPEPTPDRHLVVERPNESPRHMGRISTRTKRVLPLPIAQPIEQAARPRQIGRGDPLAHE